MIPRTPQNKKNFELELHSEPFPQKIMNHQSSHPISLLPLDETSKRKQFQDHLKSSLLGYEGGLSEINKMILAKKYAQQDIHLQLKYREREKEKEYHEVVISDEFIKSHKLYKMLKEQISVGETGQSLKLENLRHILYKEEKETEAITNQNYQTKLEIWQYRNQLMELRAMLEEEEQEYKRLTEEYEYVSHTDLEEEIQRGEGYEEDEDEEQFYELDNKFTGDNQEDKMMKVMGIENEDNLEVEEKDVIRFPQCEALYATSENSDYKVEEIQNFKTLLKSELEGYLLSKSVNFEKKKEEINFAHNESFQGDLMKCEEKYGGQLSSITHQNLRPKSEEDEEVELHRFKLGGKMKHSKVWETFEKNQTEEHEEEESAQK